MTTPAYEVSVECPKCGEEFRDWIRNSINLGLGESWTEEEIDEQFSVRCPQCGHREFTGGLIMEPVDN